MVIKEKTQSPAASKPRVAIDDRKSRLDILGDEGESYSDIFARLMDLKPKAPIARYRLPVLKKKSLVNPR
jgi:hypothetical protein